MTTEGKHPAPFTDSIIEALADIIPANVPAGHIVHDPFGGEGVRLGALCDRIGYTFSGTDLEEWKGGDPRIVLGDATDSATYPIAPHAVVTSPTYCNGVNDHFEAKDFSRRLTYRSRAGHALHPNNTGRWSGRRSKKGEVEYWRITYASVKNWPDIVIVNVKDSIRRVVEIYPLTDLWEALLKDHGYTVKRADVPCPGWRFGANGQARVDTEAILVGHRS